MTFSNHNGILGIVLDVGSRFTKAGFAGESFPRATFPTAVGRYRQAGLVDGFPLFYFGEEAVKKRGLLNLTWPSQEGQIKEWDDLEKLLHSTFYRELHVPPEQTHILFSVHPLIKRGDREKLCEMFFEAFAVKGLNLMKSPGLVLHASGRTTGVVCEIGASCSYAAPVYEGFPLKYSTILSTVNGEHLTDYLQKLLADNGYSFTTPTERNLVDEIKESACYVALDYEEEQQKKQSFGESQLRYELPDGQHVMLGEERYKCPEAMFQPSFLNSQTLSPSIVDNICSSIEKCEIDYQKIFFENVVVSGGSTLFPGFISRLSNEMMARARKHSGFKAKIIEVPTRNNCAWVGGSIISSLDCLKDFWMTKDEYEDIGPDRVNYKFF